MIVCHCNPFAEATVTNYLDEFKAKGAPIPRLSQIYADCAGNKPADCQTCVPKLKEVIDTWKKDNGIPVRTRRTKPPSDGVSTLVIEQK